MMTNDRATSPAAKLPGRVRQELAIQALAGSRPITGLADELGVSRKFVYAQTERASTALTQVFAPVANDGQPVLFELSVTHEVVEQIVVALVLMCRASYRGVVEFMRDVLGCPMSLGTVHQVLQEVARRAGTVNDSVGLSAVKVGLHDEIFQGPRPVLAGVDAQSTYCYLLASEAHRDADTWGVHLLDARLRGLDPEYTIADAGQGLRAGQSLAFEGTPCHGDVFHVQHQFESLANTLTSMADGDRSRRRKLQAGLAPSQLFDPAAERVIELDLAQQDGAQSSALARDVRTLSQWLGRDVLSLAGPDAATRRELFDFIVEELRRRESADLRRIRPLRVALQHQQDDLLAGAQVLDDKLGAIAAAHDVDGYLVRQACLLHRKPSSSTAYWSRWNRLRSKLTNKFHQVFDAVVQALATTPRCSSLVENLNSRLRTYFTLRRHLGGTYLALLQFFLNHRRFMRSRVGRAGKSPRELMTGQPHPHWFTLLGIGQPAPLRA
jgi:hypothetical protein